MLVKKLMAILATQLDNVLEEMRHSGWYKEQIPALELSSKFEVLNPKKTDSSPYNYDKRTAMPEADFNDYLRGGLRRLYLQKFGPSRNTRW